MDFSEALADRLIDQNSKTKVRSWSSMFYLAGGKDDIVPDDVADRYQVDGWTAAGESIKALEHGIDVVNVRDMFMYGNPGRSRRDIVNAEWVFNNWDPTMFGTVALLPGTRTTTRSSSPPGEATQTTPICWWIWSRTGSLAR